MKRLEMLVLGSRPQLLDDLPSGDLPEIAVHILGVLCAAFGITADQLAKAV